MHCLFLSSSCGCGKAAWVIECAGREKGLFGLQVTDVKCLLFLVPFFNFFSILDHTL